MKLLTRTMICLFPVILILDGTGRAARGYAYTRHLLYGPVSPHDDPDDHFDLACLYAIPEVDIKAVILDQGANIGEAGPHSRCSNSTGSLAGRRPPRSGLPNL